MKTNMGSVDRVVRIILGLAILALGLIFHSWWGLIGILPILTALVGWCGLYTVFGISTCKVKPKEHEHTEAPVH